MIKTILTRAGFKEGKTFKETRFLKPPKSTYAIYLDSYERRGADNANLLKSHSYTIELYAYKADPTSEVALEGVLDLFGIEFEKDPRAWLESEQLYQTIYTFDYIEK